MRLGQLARKVNVKPVQIISFLEKEHHIIVEDNLNSKIEESSLDLVLAKFKIAEPTTPSITVDVKSEPVEELPLEKEIVNDLTEPIEVETEDTAPEKETTQHENVVSDNSEVVEKLVAIDEDGEEIELNVVDGIIKAQKKELEGFKVVGKIDLPQKKKSITFMVSRGNDTKDITEEVLGLREELAKVKKEQYLARKKKRKEKSNSRKKGSRKVLTELELKEKANKLAVEKQIQNSKIDKELKKKHYKENIQPKSTPHKKKKKKETTNKDGIKTVKGYEKEATTRLGKLWKWFNT